MGPTQNFALFQLAEQMSCPVAKLLTGRDVPLGNLEHKLWQRYHTAKARLQQQQQPHKKPSRRGRH